MAEQIVINNSTPTQSDSGGFLGSSLSRVFSIIVIILVLIGLAIIGFTVYSVYINWDYIAAFFTTGFIGWLNPFDSPDGDTGPVDIVVNKVSRPLRYTGVTGPVLLTWDLIRGKL